MSMDSHNTGPHTPSKLGRSMVILSWIIALALFTFLAQDWLDGSYNPNQSPITRQGQDDRTEIVLQRNRYGHYVSSGRINGHEATFLLDTGATEVVVPEELTARYGLKRGPVYTSTTANGTIQVYGTSLNTIELGPIRLYNVRAAINPHMQGDEILLGMSFLRHLNFKQQGDQLIISAL
ncbi:MAG TPA: TIGR02281 family clan AA aspartic protease [Gammaproteobacteria bacterium]